MNVFHSLIMRWRMFRFSRALLRSNLNLKQATDLSHLLKERFNIEAVSDVFPKVIDHIQRYFRSRMADATQFTDDLISACECTLHCSVQGKAVTIEMDGRRETIASLPLATRKIGAMCDRLADLCNETAGPQVAYSGGEGLLIWNKVSQPKRLRVKMMNTPNQQWFEIHPLSEAAV